MNEPTHNAQPDLDQHVLDLLNGTIDGGLSAVETAELDKLLAGSIPARESYEELKALVGVLDELPEKVPPEYLYDAIISQVRLSVPDDVQVEKPSLFSTRLFGNWLSAPWMRTGFAVAAVLMLTIGIYRTGSENLSPEDTSSMTGTVVKNPNGVLLGSTRFNAEVMNGEVKLRYKDGFLSVDVRLESDGTAVVNLGFSGQELEYSGITGLQNTGADVAAANGSVSVTTRSGRQHYELLLRRTAELPQGESTLLILEFFADGVLVHEAELGGSR